LAALAAAQPQSRYRVVDLGTLPGGNFSQAYYVSNDRLVAGVSTVSDGTQHALFWGGPFRMDIGAPALNSAAFSVNQRGQASIQAEVSAKDPNNENFCAYGTGRKCLAFRWQQGAMIPLPTLGGNNGTVGNVNSRGEIAGVTETAIRDPQCPAGVSVSGTGPQVLAFQPVVWGPGPGVVRQLATLPGDTVGMAIWINDNGQAVGATGTCANTVLPPVAYGAHAVLWEKDGTPRDLGNLGAPALNMALAINNQGQVVGISSLTPNSTPFEASHAFLWTSQTGMRDLGTLPGDAVSVGAAINERGQVVGPSFDPHGSPRAYIWQNGAMTDLNTLIAGNSPLFLLFATGINNSGEISGFGVDGNGDLHGFLASPVNGNGRQENAPAAPDTITQVPASLPESLRVLLGPNSPVGRFQIGLPRPR
jgi:probable HAF family extracellular repeat protein